MRPLMIHNTMTREKERFTPIDPANVRVYVCGPTVYDKPHIGNARPWIVFDVLVRVLRHMYGADHVTYARNITDIDDKINARAAERGVSIAEVTEEPIRQLHANTQALNLLPPDIEPRATDHIPQMIAMIAKLVDGGLAYAAQGHVLFHVPAMSDYGRLSGRSLDDMMAGARVEVAPYKKDPMDFVLWKPSDNGEPGWESPWGYGRPGWHLECSAMTEAHFGETFDIHGGGIDLIFPHHENEIAQSTCAHDRAPFVNYWMHNGFLQVEGEKMSKSLGNFITVDDFLGDWPGEVFRLQMLMTHYRQPINWTAAASREAKTVLDKWYALAGDAAPDADPHEGVLDALRDDLNTPLAITRLHEVAGRGEAGVLKAAMGFLGFRDLTAEAWTALDTAKLGIDPAEVEALIEERLAARAAKDFGRADQIRDDLAARGVSLKDGPDGTTWTARS